MVSLKRGGADEGPRGGCGEREGVRPGLALYLHVLHGHAATVTIVHGKEAPLAARAVLFDDDDLVLVHRDGVWW